MAEIKVVNMAGAEVGTMMLADSVFAVDVNSAVLHAAVKNYLGNQRQGTQSTLTRTEVSGGGRKPWRQKGTGRARQGSTRSPQWTHGGIALGPKPRSYRTKLNKKVRRVAITSALSAKVALEQHAAYYTSPAFIGSSVARDQVGLLMQKCLSEKTDDVAGMIKKAFEDAVAECKYQAG